MKSSAHRVIAIFSAGLLVALSIPACADTSPSTPPTQVALPTAQISTLDSPAPEESNIEPTATPVPPSEPPPERTQYLLDVYLDYAQHRLEVGQQITYPNVLGRWSLESIAGLAQLSKEIGRQSSMIAHLNAFGLYTAACAATLPLILLMRSKKGSAA